MHVPRNRLCDPAAREPKQTAAVVSACVLLAAAAEARLPAQEWSARTLSSWSTRGTVCFDAARGRTVLFGGAGGPASTWLHDGTVWHRVDTPPAQTPEARIAHALAYDMANQRVVLFGGYVVSGRYANDTWLFDGTQWSRVATPQPPSARAGHQLAYDIARNRTVLFGGSDGRQALDDTWTFDGTGWTQVTTTTRPVALSGDPLMAYDVWRAQMVLIFEPTSAPSPTWLFDGVNWRASPAPRPFVTARAGMAFDIARGQCVLASQAPIGTWQFDGAAWTPVGAQTNSFVGGSMAYDIQRQRCVLVNDLPVSVEQFDGTSWTPNPAPPTTDCAIAHDGALGATVIFGSNGASYGTWEHDGTALRSFATPAAMTGGGHAMAYHTRLGATLLVDRLGATWSYRAHAWTQLQPATSPPARANHAVAYDSRTGRLLLFGGTNGTSVLNDFWAFDGTTWSAITTATVPPARSHHAFAYDPRRHRAVRFGGLDSTGALTNDTWEFDGADWLAVTRPTMPSPRVDAPMAFDPVRGRAVLVGGWFDLTNTVGFTDCWTYGADGWALLRSVAPQTRHRSRALCFAGQRLRMQIEDLWEPIDEIGWSRYGPGCAQGANQNANIAFTNQPRLGQTTQVFAFSLPAPAGTLELAIGLGLDGFGGNALPVDLPALGPDCQLWIPPDIRIAVPYGNNNVLVPIAVPNLPSLSGLVFGVQGLVTDSAGAFASLTNAITLRL